jgi:hypothetical protein
LIARLLLPDTNLSCTFLFPRRERREPFVCAGMNCQRKCIKKWINYQAENRGYRHIFFIHEGLLSANEKRLRTCFGRASQRLSNTLRAKKPAFRRPETIRDLNIRCLAGAFTPINALPRQFWPHQTQWCGPFGIAIGFFDALQHGLSIKVTSHNHDRVIWNMYAR